MQHQISHATKYNRYPEIFKMCSEYFKGKDIRILSFGCSDGREVQTLRDLYFKNSKIHGVDISQEMIDHCNKTIRDDKIKFTLTDKLEEYDLIFCMSVFCRWPQTQKINDCSREYKFSEFESQVSSLYNHLTPGGLLVIYNSNFCLSESGLYNFFTPLNDGTIKESGFVHKFNSDNKKISINYKDCVFIKQQK